MGAVGQAQAANGSGTDTVNSRVIPIVVVPGVMGSRLDIAGAVSDWDPDDLTEMAGWLAATRRSSVKDVDFRTPATLMQGLDDSVTVDPTAEIRDRTRLNQLALDQGPPKPAGGAPLGRRQRRRARARTEAAVVDFWEKRGWGEIVWSFYGELLMSLAVDLNPGDHGGEVHPVYACGYDWRQSNRDSGAKLAARIKQILAKHPLARQVIIVSHSMGGLVTRAALAQGAEPDVLGVVHTVMPADGAVVAYVRMKTGARPDIGDTEKNLNKILGNNRIEYGLMQSVLRGPVELLPTNSYPEAFLQVSGGINNKFFIDIFPEYAKQATPGVVFKAGEIMGRSPFPAEIVTAADVQNLQARIVEAGAFAPTISNRFHPKTFLLFGDKLATVVGFDATKGKETVDGTGMGAMVSRAAAGDGTVPAASGRFDACTALGRDAFPVEHAKCFGVPTFRAAVLDRVRRLVALP